MQVTEFDAAIFAWLLYLFGPAYHALVAYQMEKGGVQLHDEYQGAGTQ